jgi:hypothetical protein
MNKQSKRTYRAETSLLPLKTVLAEARKDLPPRVWQMDMNEELALELIEKMKTDYKKSTSYKFNSKFREMVKANV